MSSRNELVEICGEKIAETDDEILINDGNVEEWVPKSLMENIEEDLDDITFEIPEWFAEEKGLI